MKFLRNTLLVVLWVVPTLALLMMSAQVIYAETTSHAVRKAMLENENPHTSREEEKGLLGGTFDRFHLDTGIAAVFAGAVMSDDDRRYFGDHDVLGNGFTMQEMALSFSGRVDSYFRAHLSIAMFFDEKGKTHFDFEEGYIASDGLPYNLEIMAGQFFTRFGNLNSVLIYDWDFINQPVILNRLLGNGGLRGPGVQASWKAPTPFHLEFIGSAQQAVGRSAASFLGEKGGEVAGHHLGGRTTSGFDELLYMPRVVSEFDFTDDLHLKLGGSALLGPNATGMNTQTTIYGGDMQLRWKPQSGQGFPFFIWDTEFLYRDYETPLFEDALEDWGWYTQGLYGFAPRWVGGLRVEYADGAHGLDQEMDDLRSERYTISPNISWMTSKFSQLRLQYNFDVLESRDHEPQHGLFVQWNFQFGSPYAH